MVGAEAEAGVRGGRAGDVLKAGAGTRSPNKRKPALMPRPSRGVPDHITSTKEGRSVGRECMFGDINGEPNPCTTVVRAELFEPQVTVIVLDKLSDEEFSGANVLIGGDSVNGNPSGKSVQTVYDNLHTLVKVSPFCRDRRIVLLAVWWRQDEHLSQWRTKERRMRRGGGCEETHGFCLDQEDLR
ncbi:hypothetical protein Tcan_17653 [Toxocara canis]|uniref:Uncharacterized protein n=1 Tax=Toxocara canis TaxID=6265 RepID=A0A0B2UNW0_TOXCA|nr:hypothetical protein Tcan_17653 [Toxocara canis]